MSIIEKPFKEGHLWFPPHGVLGQLKKSWQKKYCQLFKCSKHGIDRLEVFDNEEEVGKTSSNLIITLENCIKITQDAQKHQPNVFAVITKCNSYYFSANSEDEMNEWISAFQVVAFKDNISRQTIEEDNDLYCSSGDAGVFSVKLVTSDASSRCGLTEGRYTLVVTPVALQLRDSDEEQVLFTWPYRYIRRYGYRSGKFTFEAGRKCESGEGVFHFEHSNQQEIFRCISSKMKSMKKLLNGESPSIMCGDNQFQAALSMVARSRSPLPPSPTSSTTRLLDSDLCPISSVKPLMPFPPSTVAAATTSSTTSTLTNSTLTVPTMERESSRPTLKPKPPQIKKPPRRVPPSSSSSNTATDNKTVVSGSAAAVPVSDNQPAYDDIEIRNEAWRTMGINNMSHSEPAFDIAAAHLQSSMAMKVDKSEAQKIFSSLNNNNGFDNYDRLQHIGSVPKLSTAPGYKQVGQQLLLPKTLSVPSITFEEPIFACRRADDFQGYGMIRKKSSPDISIENDISRQTAICDKMIDYAIVCKPNRV